MGRKKLVEDYLSFSRKDRIGVLVMVALIITVFFLPKFFMTSFTSRNYPADTAWIAVLRQLEVKDSSSKKQSFVRKDDEENLTTFQYDRKEYSREKKGHLFDFDPNNLPESGWKELGLREKTIHTITNYLAKGGHFKKPEDLQRVYGLHPDDYQRLLPFIHIATIEQPGFSLKTEKTRYKEKTSRYAPVDINTADTSALIALPGIGSKLASRIISFREKLGGFYSIDQVGETYGLADSVFQKIKSYLQLQNPSVKKININTATIDELKNHPYIRYTLANPIIAYRNEHGPFQHIEDIKKVMSVTEEAYKKIAPYLIVE